MLTQTTNRGERVCERCGTPCCGRMRKNHTWIVYKCDHTSERHTFEGCDGRWITPAAPQGAEGEG